MGASGHLQSDSRDSSPGSVEMLRDVLKTRSSRLVGVGHVTDPEWLELGGLGLFLIWS